MQFTSNFFYFSPIFLHFFFVYLFDFLCHQCDDDYVTEQKLEHMVLGPMVTYQYNDELISRDSDDMLMKAFELLDEERKGFLETERFLELIKSLGEPMSEEEIAEFLHAAEDPDQHVIRYEEYISRCLGYS
jgi:Ca2+-binding EF-hand superfamily protein